MYIEQGLAPSIAADPGSFMLLDVASQVLLVGKSSPLLECRVERRILPAVRKSNSLFPMSTL